MKIKRKNPSVEKLYRIAQTEKKPKQDNTQLKRYHPLTKVYQRHSDAKDKQKAYYNRDLNAREKAFIETPDIQFYDRTEDIIAEEEKYFNDQKLKVEVTFGKISKTAQKETPRVIGFNELMDDTLIKIQQNVRLLILLSLLNSILGDSI